MDLKTYDLIVILVISQRILSGIGICIESVSECYVLLMGSIAIGISICIGIGIGIAIDIAIWISERMLCGGTRSPPATACVCGPADDYASVLFPTSMKIYLVSTRCVSSYSP